MASTTKRLNIDTSQLTLLAADLARMPGRLFPQAADAVSDFGDALRDRWVENARATSGTHGRLYPDSITAETLFTAGVLSDVTAVVGPDVSFPQGGMGLGFEYGSINQPPHLDGNRAADTVVPLLVSRLTSVLASVRL